MKYDSPQLRDTLAAEYVLGTLTGRVRARFQRLLKYDVELRRIVAGWESRLAPLAALAPAVTPPARVWQAIAARVSGARRTAGFWASPGLWRSLAAVSTACVIALAALLILRQTPVEEPVSTVAVLADARSQPLMVISWPPQTTEARRHLKVKMLAQPELPAGKSFELWMLPGGSAAPVSLGVITASLTQSVPVTAAASRMLAAISAMAVSIEPAGGSPTGAPTGPVIMSGPCVKVI